MLVIEDLNKLKFTSIKNVIHFKYDNEDYFIHENTSETTTTTIYKGRSKYKNECLKSRYGFIPRLIQYKNNKNTLSSIDKEIFVKKLYKAELINTTIEHIKDQVNSEIEEEKTLRKQIYQANQRLQELNW